MQTDRSEQHYVRAGRLATVLLFVVSSGMVFVLQTAQDNFNIILQLGAGTGLLYLLRWFWWRITAWCEIVAMISSFLISLVFLLLRHNGVVLGTDKELLLTVFGTTLCWLAVAYLGPQTDPETLRHFYRKVRPGGPGWQLIRSELGDFAIKEDHADNFPLALLGWFAGTTVIWSGLFAVGNFLYGRFDYAVVLSVIFVVVSVLLINIIKRLWR